MAKQKWEHVEAARWWDVLAMQEHGWELVAVTESTGGIDGSVKTYYLKREVS